MSHPADIQGQSHNSGCLARFVSPGGVLEIKLCYCPALLVEELNKKK